MDSIEFKDVSFSYDKDPILSHTSVAVPKGKFTLIVGPNGAGKTTFLRLICGLLSPNEGQVTIDGNQVAAAQEEGIIHLVPQIYNKNASQFPASVQEIVELGLRINSKIATSERKQRVQEALEAVGMWDFRKRRIGDLSGGQQQRVMIAQALARRPRYLLLDEPTSGIDFASSERIFQLLQDLCQQKITVLMVTHDVREAARFADLVLCVDREICYFGDCQGFLNTHVDTALSWHIGG